MAENTNDQNKSFQNEYPSEIIDPLTIYINEDLKSTDPFVREQAKEMHKEKNKLILEFVKRKFEIKLQIEFKESRLSESMFKDPKLINPTFGGLINHPTFGGIINPTGGESKLINPTGGESRLINPTGRESRHNKPCWGGLADPFV